MQTLVDPFELASTTPEAPQTVGPAPVAPKPPANPPTSEEGAAKDPQPKEARADATAGLRCWCSEE